MKKTFLILCSILALLSCSEESNSEEDSYTFVFYPRECKTLATGLSELIPEEYDGVEYFEEEELDSNDTCSVEYLALILSTSNLDTLPDGADYNTYPMFYEFHQSLSAEDQQLDDNNTSLEQQIEDDYRNRIKSTSESNLEGIYFKSWEYRTTGISSFDFTCNKTLFSQPAGSSLNDFIYLHEIDMSQIISYETENLVFGYSDELDEMSISEWLTLKPMAQPTIYFRFKSVPEELNDEVIDSVEFSFKVETTDDLSLSITTQPIALEK